MKILDEQTKTDIIEKCKELSMISTHEGLGGSYYTFDEDVFADLLIKELEQFYQNNI